MWQRLESDPSGPMCASTKQYQATVLLLLPRTQRFRAHAHSSRRTWNLRCAAQNAAWYEARADEVWHIVRGGCAEHQGVKCPSVQPTAAAASAYYTAREPYCKLLPAPGASISISIFLGSTAPPCCSTEWHHSSPTPLRSGAGSKQRRHTWDGM